MSVQVSTVLQVRGTEVGSGDLGTPIQPHSIGRTADTASGTGDDQQNLIWSDTRVVASGTPDDIDVRGVLTSQIGATAFSPVEIRQIDIVNKGTTGLILGNGSNPVYAGLFGTSAGTITIPAGGEFHWRAPKDGTGLQTTAGTADILRVAAASGSVTYDILLAGVDA